MPHTAPSLAAATIPLAHAGLVEPWPRPGPGQLDPVRHWQSLLDAGLYPVRNPPTPPAVAANRAATDALFRTIAEDRRILAREYAR